LKRVYAAPTGWWASLNNGGWMKYEESSGKWVKAGLFASHSPEAPAATKVTKIVNGKKTTVLVKKPAPKAKAPQLLAFQVNDMAFTSNAWFASTTGGVVISQDHGTTWRSASKDELVKQPSQSLEASSDGSQVWAISQRNLLYSADGGAHWDARELPFASAGNLRLHRIDDNSLFITSNMGLYASKDAGRNWNRADVRDLQFQDVAGSGNALVVSLQRRGLIASFDSGKSWQRVNNAFAESYVPVVRVRRDGTVVAASATEGLLAYEPDAPRSADTSVGVTSLVPTGPAQKPKK
jgi:photosystem II stability/assembly factor-like uncharacterized protein